jgi:allantoinase
MGPWRSESNVTPDLLQEAGYRYLMDWPCDDQPFWMNTRNGRILSVPYPLEMSDGTAIARNAHSAHEFADMIVDHFEEMLDQSEKRPLVCGIALHPFVIGHAFRLRLLRKALKHCLAHGRREQVWYTVPGQIAEYCYALPKHTVPGDS